LAQRCWKTNWNLCFERRGLRITDAANYMGVTPWYVEELVRSGELPALMLCRHYTILREDADAFLDRKRGELLGANGRGWQESDAVPERRPLCGERG